MSRYGRAHFLVSIVACGLAAGVAGLASAGEPTPHKFAFVTSVAGPGNLASWPDAGTDPGLAAGDAICRSLAESAGLPNPMSYVAWLSDDANDAYCRIHNLSGTVEGNSCGVADLPEAAGPWVRTDGLPFAESIGVMLGGSGIIYRPLILDENGNPVTWERAFTDTKPDGTQDKSFTSCGNWTDESYALVTPGSVFSTTGSWSDDDVCICADDHALLCFETGVGPALPGNEGVGALAFVASVNGTGELKSWPDSGEDDVGIDAGDTICQNLAEDAGLPSHESYLAWLSAGAEDAPDRFTYDGPWIRLDGVTVAQNKADLVDGQLLAPINVTEQGEYIGDDWVWTGTSEFGVGLEDCGSWDYALASTGTVGLANITSEEWSLVFLDMECSDLNRLYCFSQVGIEIFADGFESGDLTAWPGSTP